MVQTLNLEGQEMLYPTIRTKYFYGTNNVCRRANKLEYLYDIDTSHG